MRKMLIAAMLLVLVGQAAFAQDGRMKKTPEERTEMQMKWANKNLSLTDDQSTRLQEVVLRYAKKRDSVMAQSNGERGAGRPVMEKRDTEIKGILNDDQYKKYKAHEQEMREKMMQRRNER